MRRCLLAVLALGSLACAGLGPNMGNAQKPILSGLAARVHDVPAGPGKDAVAEQLEVAWLAASQESLGTGPMLALVVAVEQALEDGALTEEEGAEVADSADIAEPELDAEVREALLAELAAEVARQLGLEEDLADREAGKSFGSWDLPDELGARAEAAGWTVVACAAEDGVSSCTLEREDRAAVAAITEHDGEDAARAHLDGLGRNEQGARDVRFVLVVQAHSVPASAELEAALAPEGTDVSELTEEVLTDRAKEAGWHLRSCAEADEELVCELHTEELVGEVRVGAELVVLAHDALVARELLHALRAPVAGADPDEPDEPDEPAPAGGEPSAEPEPGAATRRGRKGRRAAVPTPKPHTAPSPGAEVSAQGAKKVELVWGPHHLALPAHVPPGRYAIVATFDGKPPFEAGKLTVLEGDAAKVVVCDAALALCKVK